MSQNIKDFPVMKSRCTSCPFNPKGDRQVRAMVEARSLKEGSQICHHPRLYGKKETHLCRGARDHQLVIFHRLGIIKSATDRAWAAARRRFATKPRA